ncbi:hypothetical protein [Roseomonas sp. 18066]|uniref:hypothetical protein n=1 Tax=Roseomonas sp. 18066 TaxID=2681412 RepID=UPI00190F4B4A|nr:hypothetical protein [Roseomonas sp. 18066]
MVVFTISLLVNMLGLLGETAALGRVRRIGKPAGIVSVLGETSRICRRDRVRSGFPKAWIARRNGQENSDKKNRVSAEI